MYSDCIHMCCVHVKCSRFMFQNSAWKYFARSQYTHDKYAFQSFPVCMLYEWHLICHWEAATNPEPTQGSRGTNSMARWASSDSGPRRLIQTFSSGGAVCRYNQSQSIWIGWNWSNVPKISQIKSNKCSKKGVGEHISHPGTDCTSKLRNTPQWDSFTRGQHSARLAASNVLIGAQVCKGDTKHHWTWELTQKAQPCTAKPQTTSNFKASIYWNTNRLHDDWHLIMLVHHTEAERQTIYLIKYTWYITITKYIYIYIINILYIYIYIQYIYIYNIYIYTQYTQRFDLGLYLMPFCTFAFWPGSG